MISNDQKAQLLFDLEDDLNRIALKGIPIGGLLAHKYGEMINRNSHGQWISVLSALKYWLVNITVMTVKYPKIEALNDSILISKHQDVHHYNSIVDPICQHYKNNIFLYCSNKVSVSKLEPVGFKYWQSRHRISLIDALRVLLFWINKYRTVRKCFHKHHWLSIRFIPKYFEILIQLVRLQFWYKTLSINRPNKVIVEHDRNNRLSPLVLAANALNISTVVIQHGAISPLYGFRPVLARNIYVWGEFQKKIFEEFGIPNSRIKITGTPILRKVNREADYRRSLKESLVAKDTTVIGLALSAYPENILFELVTKVKLGISKIKGALLIVRVHPSHRGTELEKRLESELEVSLFKLSNDLYLQLIDGIITHSSGMADEAIANNIPSACYTALPLDKGHANTLIDQMGSRELRSASDIKDWVLILMTGDKKQATLPYYKIGKEAQKEIIRCLEG